MEHLVEILFLNKENEYIKLDFTNKIIELKLFVKEMFGPNIDEQIWLLNEKNIKSDFLQIKKNDNIKIIINNKYYQIYIKNINNQLIKLPRINSTHTIYNIKLLLFSKFKIRPDKFKLLFNNNILNDSKYISYYNIKNNSILNIIINNNSGFY